jgi:hypothetical protein
MKIRSFFSNPKGGTPPLVCETYLAVRGLLPRFSRPKWVLRNESGYFSP